MFNEWMVFIMEYTIGKAFPVDVAILPVGNENIVIRLPVFSSRQHKSLFESKTNVQQLNFVGSTLL